MEAPATKVYLCHINASSSVELDGENICPVPLLDEKWVSGKSWQMGLLLGPSGSGKRFHKIFTHGAEPIAYSGIETHPSEF